MRVKVEAPEGTKMVGNVVGGEFFDERLANCALTETSTLQPDEGGYYSIHGWQVKTTLLDPISFTNKLILAAKPVSGLNPHELTSDVWVSA